MLVFDENKRLNSFKIRKHSTTVWVSLVTDQWEELPITKAFQNKGILYIITSTSLI